MRESRDSPFSDLNWNRDDPRVPSPVLLASDDADVVSIRRAYFEGPQGCGFQRFIANTVLAISNDSRSIPRPSLQLVLDLNPPPPNFKLVVGIARSLPAYVKLARSLTAARSIARNDS